VRDSNGVNVATLGNNIFAAVKDDAAACAKIRAEFKSLSLQLLTDPNASARVTSATVNGQTFSAQSTMTNAQRLHLLRWVVACLDSSSPISSTQLTTF
jgi:hypothetical protein